MLKSCVLNIVLMAVFYPAAHYRVFVLLKFFLRSVPDKQHWDGAIKFLADNLTEKIENNEANLKEMVGPGWYQRWTKWQSSTPEQKSRSMARVELEKLLSSDPEHGPHLAYEEVTTVRRNLATQGLEVDNELIRETWYPTFRRNFLRGALGRCYDCRKGFWMYKQVSALVKFTCFYLLL